MIPDPIPHLTVGQFVDSLTADDIEAAVAPGLPISCVVDRLTLLVEDDQGNWRVARFWPLGDV
jgi:2'-5' RNA ligase superfamily protein